MKRNQSQKVFRLSKERRKEQQAISCPPPSGFIIAVILISTAIVTGIISLAIWVNSCRRIQHTYDTYVTSLDRFLDEAAEEEGEEVEPTPQPQPQPQQPTTQQSQPTQGEPIVINNNIYVSDDSQTTPSED